MTTNLLRRVVATLGIASAVSLTSCVYDPYYGGGGASYYGGGGGYYSSSSVFVTTGDPRWGYDPYCHSYYDYSRRAYYDPYRYGYYPVGYRPPIVYGVPHPHGWRPGYCPPPRRVSTIVLRDYRNRGDAYRRLNYDWARRVQQREDGRSFNPPSRPGGNSQFGGQGNFRPNGQNSPKFKGQGSPQFNGQGSSQYKAPYNQPQNPSWKNGQGFDPGRNVQPRPSMDGQRRRSGDSSAYQRQVQPQVKPTTRFTPGDGGSYQPQRRSSGGGGQNYQPKQRSGGGQNYQPQQRQGGGENSGGNRGKSGKYQRDDQPPI